MIDEGHVGRRAGFIGDLRGRGQVVLVLETTKETTKGTGPIVPISGLALVFILRTAKPSWLAVSRAQLSPP